MKFASRVVTGVVDVLLIVGVSVVILVVLTADVVILPAKSILQSSHLYVIISKYTPVIPLYS